MRIVKHPINTHRILSIIGTYANYFIDLTTAPIRHFPVFTLFTILMSNAICVAANMNGIGTDYFLSFILSIFDCYLFTLCAHLVRKIKLSRVVVAIVAFFLVAELFTIFFYHSLFGIYVVQLIVETNPKESGEFLTSAFRSNAMWKTLCSTLFLWLLCYSIAYIGRKRLNLKYVKFAVFFLVVWSGIRQSHTYFKLNNCLHAATLSECMDNRNIPRLSTTFVRFAYGLAYNMAASSELSVLVHSIEGTSVSANSMKSKQIVLIIGESYNKHHSQLYNHDYLPTTPCLEKWEQKGNLVVYDDAVTPFNVTSEVLKYMFSTWDEESSGDWTAYSLFPASFKKAGYDVHFVSNQFIQSSDSKWSLMGGTIFNSSKLSDLQFTTRNSNVYDYDMELLREIPNIDSLRKTPNLLIVHLMGQHVDYSERYPKDLRRFSATDEKNLFGGSSGREMVAHYDNATYYNDMVIDSIFRIFKNEDAVCIYLADHGEEIYDWRNSYERTQENPIPKEVLVNQYEIPLMFWMSDKYMKTHAELTAQVKASSSHRFISTDLCHTLFYLAGIKTKDFQECKCVISPNYNNNRKRTIRHDTDYDVVMQK